MTIQIAQELEPHRETIEAEVAKLKDELGEFEAPEFRKFTEAEWTAFLEIILENASSRLGINKTHVRKIAERKARESYARKVISTHAFYYHFRNVVLLGLTQTAKRKMPEILRHEVTHAFAEQKVPGVKRPAKSYFPQLLAQHLGKDAIELDQMYERLYVSRILNEGIATFVSGSPRVSFRTWYMDADKIKSFRQAQMNPPWEVYSVGVLYVQRESETLELLGVGHLGEKMIRIGRDAPKDLNMLLDSLYE